MCCGVVPILFGWFLRVPSLHALVFIWKTFLWLVNLLLTNEFSNLRPYKTSSVLLTCNLGETVWLLIPSNACPMVWSEREEIALKKWSGHWAIATGQLSHSPIHSAHAVGTLCFSYSMWIDMQLKTAGFDSLYIDFSLFQFIPSNIYLYSWGNIF